MCTWYIFLLFPCVCLSFCLSVCLSVCLYVCLCLSLFQLPFHSILREIFPPSTSPQAASPLAGSAAVSVSATCVQPWHIREALRRYAASSTCLSPLSVSLASSEYEPLQFLVLYTLHCFSSSLFWHYKLKTRSCNVKNWQLTNAWGYMGFACIYTILICGLENKYFFQSRELNYISS